MKNKWTSAHRFGWTNWTFGFWWGPIGKRFFIGVDLGPLELVWKRQR